MRRDHPTIILPLILTLLACRVGAATPAAVAQPEQPSPSPDLPGPPGGLDIVALDAAGNVLILNQTGERAALTDDAGATNRYSQPTWSPDGLLLAFLQSTLFGDSIRVYHALTGELNTLFASEEEFVIYLYWSPDGQHLSFLTGGGLPSDLLLYWANIETGALQILAQGQPLYWAFSTQGNQIALHLNGGSVGSVIGLLDPFSTTLVPAAFDLGPGYFQSPSWHPDGESIIAAASDALGHSQIVRASAEETQILYEGYGRVAFTPSPDGRYLAIIENLDPARSQFTGPLRILELASGETFYLADNADNFAFFWSPDSANLLVFSFSSSPGNDLQGSQSGYHRARSLFQAISVTVHIVDLETAASRVIVANYIPTNDLGQMLIFFDQYQHSHHLWSADSSTVILSSISDESVPEIWLYAILQGEPPGFLLNGDLGLFAPVSSP